MVFSREAGSLKIATFNINNINKRLHNLTGWLARAQPDVVCLQELKVEQRAFPATALRDFGYQGVWLGELERCGDPGAGFRTSANAIEFTWESKRSQGSLHPGGGKWCADRFDLPAERKSSTRSEIRLQIGLARTSSRAWGGTRESRGAGRLGWRLQRRTDCAGHLSNTIS